MTPEWLDQSSTPDCIALSCPVCGAAGPHPVLLRQMRTPGGIEGAAPHTLVRCTGCTACVFQDRTTPDYGNEAESELFQQMYLEQNAGIHHMVGVLFRLDGQGARSVLDVGCGFGYPVDLAAKVLGWRACGVDPAHYAEIGAKLLQVDLRREYLTDASKLGEPFGLVMGSEVIEHIPTPYSFIALLRRWMQPGGTLVLTTPNADMLHPEQDPANLVCMLSVGAHVILYSARAIEVLLRRSGFAHIHTESDGNTLTAFASDQPLRFDPEAPARHLAGYRAYLEHLVATAELGRPLWNGAAGRLFELHSGGAPPAEALALWDRIARAWRSQFGIDLLRRHLPAPLREAEFGRNAMALLQAHAAAQPFNLGAVLAARAVLEHRLPGHTPESVLSYARPAFTVCVQARRVLEEAGLIDLALRNWAVQARLLMLDSLAELAPELELELLAAIAAGSGGTLGGRIDIPPGRMLPRMAQPFIRAVEEGRMQEAARLAPALQDLDAVVAAQHSDPVTIILLLQAIGMLRLHFGDPAGARAAFAGMAAQAAGWGAHPDWSAQAGPLLTLANIHVSHMDGLARPADAAAPAAAC